MTVKTTGVVSNRIFNEINDSMFEAVNEFNVKWHNKEHRYAMSMSTELFLNEYIERNEIINFKVICDERNNVFDINTLVYNFDIIFRQNHCINKTQLNYIINTKIK